MEITRIDGCTRVIGEAQGYIALPLRDVAVDDGVGGLGTPAMESAWLPTQDEIAAIVAGSPIILRVLGRGHPPVSLYATTPAEGASQVEIHTKIVPPIVAAIARPPLDAGGAMTDVLVVLESVVVGVALLAVKLGGDEIVLDAMLAGAKQRLAEIRLAPTNDDGVPN